MCADDFAARIAERSPEDSNAKQTDFALTRYQYKIDFNDIGKYM